MSATVRANADGSASILVGAIEAIRVNAAGNVTITLSTTSYANDAAAAAAGVPVGGLYNSTGSAKVRLV